MNHGYFPNFFILTLLSSFYTTSIQDDVIIKNI